MLENSTFLFYATFPFSSRFYLEWLQRDVKREIYRNFIIFNNLFPSVSSIKYLLEVDMDGASSSGCLKQALKMSVLWRCLCNVPCHPTVQIYKVKTPAFLTRENSTGIGPNLFL